MTRAEIVDQISQDTNHLTKKEMDTVLVLFLIKQQSKKQNKG